MLIVDLDKLNLGELLEIGHERMCDCVKCAVRLAITLKVNVRNTVCEDQFAIACETIEHKSEPSVSFNVARTFEKLIKNRADKILRRGNKTRHRDFIWELARNQPVIICEVNINLYI